MSVWSFEEEAVPTDTTTLREWVREHKVTWELGPWHEMVDHHATAVGFELRLLARHASGLHPMPGCGQCVQLYERLRDIALGAFPREHRPTKYEVEPFDASFHLRPEAEWTPEVQLTVHIVHREGYLRPIDTCEKRCAEEIQRNLRELGVQPKSWSPGRTA